MRPSSADEAHDVAAASEPRHSRGACARLPRRALALGAARGGKVRERAAQQPAVAHPGALVQRVGEEGLLHQRILLPQRPGRHHARRAAACGACSARLTRRAGAAKWQPGSRATGAERVLARESGAVHWTQERSLLLKQQLCGRGQAESYMQAHQRRARCPRPAAAAA